MLRLAGRKDEALSVCQKSKQLDLFNYGCRYEEYLLTGDKAVLDDLINLMHKQFNNYDELALDYWRCGQNEVAADIWQLADDNGATTAMTYYYMGLAGKEEGFDLGAKACSDYCFPNRLEAILALQAAIDHNAEDAKAHYYLGTLYYGARQYDVAREHWLRSAELDPTFPTVWRNLALEEFNKENNPEQAVADMEKAFSLNTRDSRILMELDQLYKRLGYDHDMRLKHLEQYPELIAQRDDLLLEEITLLNLTGHYEQAKEKLDVHQFHPWEGGEGKVSGQYQLSRVELARQALDRKDFDAAIQLLNECLVYPPHLGEGKLYGAQENDFYYFLGCAYDAKGEMEKARECWEKATLGPTEPAAAMYYNDAKPDKIFYQGLALLKLGRIGEAHGRFYKLLNYGKNHLFDHVVMDYFAVSLPDLQIWEGNLDQANRVHCNYMLALGYYGLHDETHSMKHLALATQLDPNHLGIYQFRTFINPSVI